jgi:hypothetical protein
MGIFVFFSSFFFSRKILDQAAAGSGHAEGCIGQRRHEGTARNGPFDLDHAVAAVGWHSAGKAAHVCSARH